MYFRNLVLSAFVIAIFSGFCFSLYQSFFITPLILQAEVYEVAEPVNQATEIEAAWEPSDGLERESWSFAANFLLCFAYALILLSLMSLHSGVNRFNAVLWGGAAFLGVFVAPALGLPPEIPGMQAAYLEGRQSWWLLTVFISLLSLWLISFKAPIHKLIGLIFISLPHLIGAPQAELHGFSHSDPLAISALTEIWHQFLLQTSLANAGLWLLIAMMSGYAVETYIYTIEPDDKKTN